MTTPANAPAHDAAKQPRSLPRNLRPPVKPFPFPGGKVGLVMFLTTAAAVAYFGFVAWGRFGSAFKKVFATNASSHYANRQEFFVSRLQEIEKAGSGRRFAFSSISISPRKLKAWREGDAMILDASDAKGNLAAEAEAKEMEEFRRPGADLTKLELRFVKPWDYAEIAKAAAALFERVLDGAPEGVVDRQGRTLGEIVFDDL
jgi:hypothetical protein